MKRCIILISTIVLMFSLVSCTSYTTPLQQQTLSYILQEEVIPSDAVQLTVLYAEKIDEDTFVSRLILFENEDDIFAICFDSIDDNNIHATVYSNVAYTTSKEKGESKPTYTVTMKHAYPIWDKRVSYGSIIVEDWEDDSYE